MPRGSWRAIVAAGGIAAATLAWGQPTAEPRKIVDEPRYSANAAKYYDDAAASYQPPPPPSFSYHPAAEQVRAVSPANDCSDKCKTDLADLAAQQGMESAAWWMFKATVASVVAGLVTVVLVGFTLYYTKRAALAAERAVVAQIEPFVTVEFIDDGIAWDGVKYNTQKEYWFRIHNAGSSPIHVRRLYRRWTVLPRGSYPAPLREALERGGDHKPTKAGAGNDGWLKHCAIPVAAHSASTAIRSELKGSSIIPEVGMWTFFDGYAVYEDLEHRKFATGFCILFDGDRFHLAWPEEGPDQHNYRIKDPPSY